MIVMFIRVWFVDSYCTCVCAFVFWILFVSMYGQKEEKICDKAIQNLVEIGSVYFVNLQ